MKPTIELTESNFAGEVLQAGQPVLVDFWAEWCGPCKMLAPALDELGREFAGRAKVAKVNINEQPALAARFRVQSIPTLIYFAGGVPRDQTLGVTSKKAMAAKLEALLLQAPAAVTN